MLYVTGSIGLNTDTQIAKALQFENKERIEADTNMRKFLLKALLLAVKNGFSAVGACWAFLEIFDYYYPEIVGPIKDNIWVMIFAFAVIAFATFLHCIWVKVVCTIGNTKIVIKPGNIIRKKDGCIVVGINSQKETHEENLAENSIHRQLVKKYGEDVFLDLFANAVFIQEVFFKGQIRNKHFIFLCMSDVDNGIACTTKQKLQCALKTLFNNQTMFDVFKRKIYFPVLGTGGSGIGLSKQDTIKLIKNAFLDCQCKKADERIERIDVLNIIVHWRDINQIDWAELNTWLQMRKNYCMDCERKERTSGVC